MKEYIFSPEGMKKNYPGQGKVYLAVSDKQRKNNPVLLAIHGNERKSTSYRDVNFYQFQRDIALKNGYIFVSLSNGSDTWGLDNGLKNLVILYNYIIEKYSVQSKWALWGTSAGGVLMHRFIYEHPERVSFAIGTFPVFDLLSSFDIIPGCRTAWGTSDKLQFKKTISGRNPPDFVEHLTKHEYIIGHGINDTAVTIKANSIKFRDIVNGMGGNVKLHISTGGHSIKDYSVYDNEAIGSAFLRYS